MTLQLFAVSLFLYLCKSPETLVREYFAARKNLHVHLFANTFLFLFTNSLFLRGGEKSGKIPLFSNLKLFLVNVA